GKPFTACGFRTGSLRCPKPRSSQRGFYGRLVERDRPRRACDPRGLGADESARHRSSATAVGGGGRLRPGDAGAGGQAAHQAGGGVAASRRRSTALPLTPAPSAAVRRGGAGWSEDRGDRSHELVEIERL